MASVDEWIDRCFKGLEEEPNFFQDTQWHEQAVKNLNKDIFTNNKIGQLTSPQFIQIYTNNFMQGRPNNRASIINEANTELAKVKKYLYAVQKFNGTSDTMEDLLDASNSIHIKGTGLFFLTQLLAGAYIDQYIVFEPQVYTSLKEFNLNKGVNIGSSINGKQYLQINEICKDLYQQKFKSRMQSYKFGLQSVHNFLWHYQYYKVHGTWWKIK